MDSEDGRFRGFLLKLSSNMNDGELQIMLYRCVSIPKRKKEDITTIIHLWEALEELDLLSPHNLDFLQQLLEVINRQDLLKMLKEFRLSSGDSNVTVKKQDNNAELTKGMKYVATQLGRHWKNVARSLGLSEPDIEQIMEENPRNLKEQCLQLIILWKQSNQEKATDDALCKALRECEMNLTADKLMGMAS